MKPTEIKQGQKLWWRRQEVEIIAEPSEGVVPVRLPDGTYKIAKVYDLDLPPTARIHAWWNKDSFVISRIDLSGEQVRISIPKEVLPELRRVMFSKKQMIRDSMKPVDFTEEQNEDTK